MIISIHQPQYLPWLGFFDKMDKSDIFVFLDDVQFKKNEWQNRNKIKTAKGWQWITVPVLHNFPQKIKDVRINNSIPWPRRHFNSLVINYNKASYFNLYRDFFKDIYERKCEYLSKLNIYIIEYLAKAFGIKTEMIKASDLKVAGDQTDHLITICKELNADTYLSGIGAKVYLDVIEFNKQGIKVIFQEFKHPVYKQLYSQGDLKFLSCMSCIDLLFNHGPNSLNILRAEECLR